MKQLLCFALALSASAHADTMDHYMNIVNQLPQMEIKADPESQTWAKSAHTVITLACDSILESLLLANDVAKQHGKPLFCLPPGANLTSEQLDTLIQKAYRETSANLTDKDKLTVSQIALMSLQKAYPC